jgi:hypothetical protein
MAIPWSCAKIPQTPKFKWLSFAVDGISFFNMEHPKIPPTAREILSAVVHVDDARANTTMI